MAVEFGIDVDVGGDVEFGAEYEAGGEALTYAAGADAVDAALGAVRRRARGYVPAGANKSKGMFTYFVNLIPNAASYAGGGVAGASQATCNTPYQVIDLIAIESTAATFNLTSFFVGDTNMWLGAAAIPAAIFAPLVQNRFVRFTSVQRGQTIQVVTVPTAVGLTTRTYTCALVLKVRSYRRS
jgi:hypothetical protein